MAAKPAQARRTIQWAMYVLLALLVVGGLSAKVGFDQRFGTLNQRQHMETQTRNQASQWVYQFRQRLESFHGTRTPIESVEQRMGDVDFVQTERHDPIDRTEYTYVAPRHGMEADIYYRGDLVVGSYVDFNNRVRFSASLPQRLPIERVIGTTGRMLSPVLGKMFTPIVGVPWLILLVWSAVDSDRRWLAHLLLVYLTVGSCLIWLMAPNYALTVGGVMSNDRMFWGVIMLVGTAIMIWRQFATQRTLDPRLCRGCGYNLTGNMSGKCPECGVVMPARQAALLKPQADQS